MTIYWICVWIFQSSKWITTLSYSSYGCCISNTSFGQYNSWYSFFPLVFFMFMDDGGWLSDEAGIGQVTPVNTITITSLFFFADWPTCLSMLVGAVSSFWCIIYRMEYTSFRAIILVCSKLVGIQACCFMYVCVCVFLSPSLNVNVGWLEMIIFW